MGPSSLAKSRSVRTLPSLRTDRDLASEDGMGLNALRYRKFREKVSSVIN